MQKNAEHTSSRSSTCPDAQNEVHSALKPPVTRRRALPHDQIYGGPISVVSILTRSKFVSAIFLSSSFFRSSYLCF